MCGVNSVTHVVWLLSVIAGQPSSAPATGPAEQLFKHPSGLFSLSYPTGWTVTPRGPVGREIVMFKPRDAGDALVTISVSDGLRLPDELPNEMLDAGFPDAEPRNAVHRCTWHGHQLMMRNFVVNEARRRERVWVLGMLIRRGNTVVLISVRDTDPGMRLRTHQYAPLILSVRVADE
jgi:hypothetical protein